MSQLGSRLAGVIGPALGAVLVAAGGTAAAFGIDALTFIVSAALLVVPLVSRRRATTTTPSTPTLGLAWTSAVQDHVPDDRLGRIYSVDALGSYALIPIGFVVAGAASDAIGPSAVFIAGGLVSAVMLAVVWALPSIRRLD